MYPIYIYIHVCAFIEKNIFYFEPAYTAQFQNLGNCPCKFRSRSQLVPNKAEARDVRPSNRPQTSQDLAKYKSFNS